ncbi:MAG: DUF6427 family protein [Bacteroidota bacterium]
MITSLFRKSTPLNYALVLLLMLVFFFLYESQVFSGDNLAVFIIKKAGILFLLLASLFTANFIIKKNGLSKDSSYTVLFYFLLLLFFPSVLDNFNLIIANFFILMAIRRLMSLQSMKMQKEKIFDASLWIFAASLFQFWSILFIVLVFVSILFHAAKDYRNWVLPFIAFFAVAVLFLMYATLTDINIINELIANAYVNFKIDYFTNKYQNIALSIYVSVALFFITTMGLTLSNRPLILHSAYKKIIVYFFIGIAIFLISDNKSNDLLLFTFAPLAIIATSYIEFSKEQLSQEIVGFVLIACSLFTFFSQL